MFFPLKVSVQQEGLNTQYLDTRDVGDGSCSAGLGQVYVYELLGPSR